MFEAREDQDFGETTNRFEKSLDEERESGDSESPSCHDCFKESSDNKKGLEKVGEKENVENQVPNLNKQATNFHRRSVLVADEQIVKLLSPPI